MAHQFLSLKLIGDCPLILHNGQTADPMNRHAKALKQVSSKRAKTDADFAEMARIEWYASLYTDKGKICLPAEVLEAAFVAGSKKLKLGKQTLAGLFVKDNALLSFDGDELTIDELWERDQNRFTTGVRIGTNRVMRTRSRFNEWSTQIDVVYDDSLLNKSQVLDSIRITGVQVGLCAWRPKFGRFSVE